MSDCALCAILRPILSRSRPRLFETPPISESEYARLVAVPKALRTLEEERQMVDYFLVLIRDEWPSRQWPTAESSQHLESAAAQITLQAERTLWRAVGLIVLENPNAFERLLLRWPEPQNELLFESPLQNSSRERLGSA
jgi:hypothetical protein